MIRGHNFSRFFGRSQWNQNKNFDTLNIILGYFSLYFVGIFGFGQLTSSVCYATRTQFNC